MILLNMSSAYAGQDKLTIAVGKDAYITSGPRANLGRYPLNSNIFESLTSFDQQFGLQPGLAVSWGYKGNNTWRFYLRKGVKFHDGSPLNAAAVRASLEQQAENGTSLCDFASIKDASEDSIDIATPEENLILPYILSHPYMGIVKPATKPVGTGPFRFSRYAKEQYLEVARNDAYWGEQAKSAGIIFRFLPDNASRVMAFLAGEMDILADVPWEILPQLQADPSCRLHTSPVGTYTGLMLSGKGATGDKSVRQAIAMGIERNAIIKALWHGFGEARQTLLAPSFLGEYAGLIPDIPYQPEKAKALLRGKKVSLTLVSGFPNADVHGPLPEILQAQLKAIGLDVQIQKISDSGLYHSLMKAHKGDLWLEKGNLNSADLTFLPHLLFHPQGYYPKHLHTVAGTEAFCEFIDRARKSQDMEELRKSTALALREIIHEELFFIPIAELPFLLAADMEVPELYPTLLTTRWDHFRKK